MSKEILHRNDRIAIMLVGLALPLYALFNAPFAGADFAQVMRFYAFPTLASCALVIWLAAGRARGLAPLVALLGKPVMVVLAAASIFALVTALTSSWPEKSSTRTALKLVVLFFGLALAFLLSTRWAEERDRLVRTLLIGFLAYTGSLFLYLAIYWGAADVEWRYFGFSGHNIRSTALYVSLGVLMALGCAATKIVSGRALLPLATAVIGTTFVAWSGSRGVFAMIIFCPLAAFVLVGKQTFFRLIKYLALTLAISLPASLVIPLPDYRYGLLRSINAHGEGISRFDTGRIELWGLTSDYIADMGVFGYGDGLFFNIVTEKHAEIYQPQPHNFPLEMIFSFGWLGGALILLLLAILLWKTLRACKRDASRLGATLPIVSMAVLSLAYAPLYDPISTVLLAIFAALALSARPAIERPSAGIPGA